MKHFSTKILIFLWIFLLLGFAATSGCRTQPETVNPPGLVESGSSTDKKDSQREEPEPSPPLEPLRQETLALEEGQVVYVVTPQQERDVALQVDGPGVSLRVDHRFGTRFPEGLWFEAPKTANYTFLMIPLTQENAAEIPAWSKQVFPSESARERTIAKAFTRWQWEMQKQLGPDPDGAEAKQVAAAAKALREEDELILAGRAFMDLASLLEKSGDGQAAREALGFALTQFRSEAADLWTSVAARALAELCERLHAYPEAIEAYRLAYRIIQDREQQNLLGLLKNNLAKLLTDIGSAEEALEEFRLALSLYEVSGNRSSQAIVLGNRGLAYAALGKYTLAQADYDLSAAKATEANRQDLVADAILEQGWLAKLNGDKEAALTHIEKAFQVRQAAGLQAPGALDRWGSLLRDQGRFQEAEVKYREALQIFQSQERVVDVAHVLSNLAEVSMLKGEAQAVGSYLDQAFAIFHSHRMRLPLANIWYQRARLAMLEQRETEVGPAFEEGLALLDAIRNETQNAHLLRGFSAVYGLLVDAYVQWLCLQVEEGVGSVHATKALELLEGTRAMNLRRAIHRPNSIRSNPNQELDRAERILAGLESVKTEYMDSPALKNHRQSLAQAVAEYYRVRNRSNLGVLEPLPIYSVGRIQDLLHHRQGALIFQMGKDASYLWEVTDRQVALHPLPSTEVLEPLLLAWHRSLSQPSNHSTQRELLAEKLSQVLLKPLQHVSAKRDWLVVPHGALNLVPLQALPLPEKGSPVFTVHTVTLVPSLSTSFDLLAREQFRPIATTSLLAFGDARYEALSVNPQAQALPVEHTRQDVSRNLPFSREEVLAIGEFFPAEARSLFLGHQVKRGALGLLGNQKSRFLHFATHGFHHADHGDLSSLVLSRFDEWGNPIEAQLRALEIQDWQLESDLVVLSACQTGVGEEVGGEGVWGLGQAFLMAGASRVVVSLWSVNDRATQTFMTKFYRAMMVGGQAPADALVQVRREMLAHSRTADPYYWAGFVLQGAPIRQPDGRLH